MNTQIDTSITARKSLALHHIEASKRLSELRLVRDYAEGVADANKTPKGNHKKSYAVALEKALNDCRSQHEIVRGIESQIASLAHDVRVADLSLTEATRSARIDAIVSEFKLQPFNRMTVEWAGAFNIWMAQRVAKGHKEYSNPFTDGRKVAFDLTGGLKLLDCSNQNERGAERVYAPAFLHLVLSFNSIGEVEDAKLYRGQMRSANTDTGSNFLCDNWGIECDGYERDFNLSTNGGTPQDIITYAHALLVAVKVNATLRQFPQGGRYPNYDTDALVTEWAAL
jgi:hypothetical protein